jgi:predicted exporter
LEHEEQLRSRLDLEITQGNLQSYLAVSVFIPSIAVQRRNYEAAKALLPLASRQFEYLGFPQESVDIFRQHFAAAQETYMSPEGDIPEFLKDLTANLWIGKAGTHYYTCVLPLHTKNEAVFRAIAADLDSSFFVNKVQDIGRELNALTRIMLLLFAAAYVLISGIVSFFYTRSQALRICAIPLLLILVSLAVLAYMDIPLGFFSVVGMVLVFGLGLDYMFYMTESEKQAVGTGGTNAGCGLTVLGIVLSFVTTGLSFGALVLSSFVPVHIFGLTVFVGLSAAFISALLLRS